MRSYRVALRPHLAPMPRHALPRRASRHAGRKGFRDDTPALAGIYTKSTKIEDIVKNSESYIWYLPIVFARWRGARGSLYGAALVPAAHRRPRAAEVAEPRHRRCCAARCRTAAARADCGCERLRTTARATRATLIFCSPVQIRSCMAHAMAYAAVHAAACVAAHRRQLPRQGAARRRHRRR